MRSPYRALVLRIVFIYIVVSAVWIVLSDSLIFVLWADAAWIVQTSKGWLFVLFSGGILYFLLDHAMAERSRFEQELETYAHYQETVSALRQSALLKSEQNILFNQAVSLVALTLNTEYTSLFEHRVSEKQMVLRACTGWSDGLIGKTPFQASPGTLAHYVLQTNEPLLVNRLANDRRFTRAESYLQQHGITSTMQVAIMAETGQVFGILGAHTTGKRDFLPDECHFLQEIANVLAIAIGREQTEAALRVQKTILECQTEASLDGILVVDTQGIIRSINQRFRDMWRLPLHDQALSHALILEGIRAQLVDFDPFIQRIRDLVAQGDAQHHEEIVLRDGRVIDSYTAPVQDATGNYYGRVWYYRDITELRRTEATLREREEIFRRLVDSMDDIIFTLDCQQRHTGIFGRWLERYGIPASFFLGKTSYEIADPETARIHEQANTRALQGEYVVYDWLSGDPPVSVQTSLSPMYDSQGQVTGLVGVGRDITALKQAEEAYRTVVEHSLQGLVIYQDERLVFANETMARINGYSVAEMLQWTFDNLNQLIYPDDRAFVWGILKQRISDQFAPASYEYRITRKDGQVRWVEASGTRITYRGKAAAQGAYIDITERKIAEEALHASHKLLQKVLSSLDEAVFVVNPQTREIFECNHTAEVIFGYTREEMLHQKTDILHVNEEMRKLFAEKVLQSYQLPGFLAMEHQMKRKNGGIFPSEHVVTPIYDDEGAVHNVVSVIRDITERKRFEQEIQKRNHELSTLNMMIEAVTMSLELTDVLITLQMIFAERLRIAGGAIFLYHDEQDDLTLASSWGLPTSMVTACKQLSVSQAYNEAVVREQQPIVRVNWSEDAPVLAALLQTNNPAWQSYLGVPLVAQGNVQGVADLFHTRTDTFSPEDIAFLTILGQQVGSAIQNARLFDAVSNARERLQVLSHQLINVQEAERRYIAAELHDEIGQSLTGLHLTLELFARLPIEQARERLSQAQALLDTLMGQVREMSLSLRPPMLDDLGLLPTLHWHMERYTDQTGIAVRFHQKGIERRFTPGLEIAVYRMVQEALTNVARYAQVTEVFVHIRANSTALDIQIEDEGIGFDLDDVLSRQASNGLSSMLERTRLLGGDLIIDSTIGQGCCISAHLPLLKQEVEEL